LGRFDNVELEPFVQLFFELALDSRADWSISTVDGEVIGGNDRMFEEGCFPE
jgi:hypothetical protein